MKLLAQLNDQTVLGRPGTSQAIPRMTARAVVRNNEDLYAVMFSEKFGLYSLPGGGIEAGESILTALHREILEETGCACDTVQELGLVTENRACHDFTQHNYYFAVHTHHCIQPALTPKEQENKTKVLWCSFAEMLRLIGGAQHSTEQRKYIQARDLAALQEYRARYLPLGSLVSVTVDRPLGSRHPQHPDILYPVNYGFIPGISASDGEEQDAYILGISEPAAAFTGRVIAIIHRKNDVENKWVVAPEGISFTPEEIRELTAFQEQYFDTTLSLAP